MVAWCLLATYLCLFLELQFLKVWLKLFSCIIPSSYMFFVPFVVLTPVILTILPMSPISLQIGDIISLTCTALGGPRLVLTWLKNGTEVAANQMGISTLDFTLNLTDSCDFGNYTCNAAIDGMQESSTVLVVTTSEFMYYMVATIVWLLHWSNHYKCCIYVMYHGYE